MQQQQETWQKRATTNRTHTEEQIHKQTQIETVCVPDENQNTRNNG